MCAETNQHAQNENEPPSSAMILCACRQSRHQQIFASLMQLSGQHQHSKEKQRCHTMTLICRCEQTQQRANKGREARYHG